MSKLLGALAAGAAGYLQGKQMQEDRKEMREYRKKRGELMDAQKGFYDRSTMQETGIDPETGLTPAVPYRGPDPDPRAIVGEPQPPLTVSTDFRYADGGMIGDCRAGTPPDPRCNWNRGSFKKARG
ncbi:MAG: hypothetical protein WDA07_06495 [Leucobacter sp.]